MCMRSQQKKDKIKQNTHVKNKIQKKKDEFKFGARIGKNKDNQ